MIGRSLRRWGWLGLSLLGAAISAAAESPVYPGKEWTTAAPDTVGLDAAKLAAARDYALTGGGAGIVIRQGRLVLAWGDTAQRFDLKSTTKSIGAMALGVAILDGKVALDDRAVRHHPAFGVPPDSNRETGWLDRITLRHLATHTAGFEKPGGYGKLLFEPGTQWAYSDAGPNWLAECITLAYRRDVAELMFERVFTPIGITANDLKWRNNSYRAHDIDGIPRREFGSGVSANVNAMARLGYLHLRGGVWNDQQLLPADFVRQSGTTVDGIVGLPETKGETHGNASDHYGLLWWNNADGSLRDVPRDAFWSWGLHDSLIVVMPGLELVAARAGQSWPRKKDAEHYAILAPFLGPLAQSVRSPEDLLERKMPSKDAVPLRAPAAPYPPSPVIAGIEWAPVDTIVRRARGSDNWPMTWGDDDALYTTYGDGKGFQPFIDTKLSLGLARIIGPADEFQTVNLRSASVESLGDGPKGKKGSGLLMVDGRLYLLARNAGNARLAWSADRGSTWTWCEWTFSESLGCPGFVNFGRNYTGARDDYVYIHSHDHASAYEPADRMVLARVPKNSLIDQSAYEFYAGRNPAGDPRWTRDVRERAAVFTHPGNCYRSGMTYNAPLGRYLWCQTLPSDDPRFQGGFGIYDAPEPWGPWTTAFFTPAWDVGPGESSSLPTKWMSADGRTVHLVFSGDDSFSIRRGVLTLKSTAEK